MGRESTKEIKAVATTFGASKADTVLAKILNEKQDKRLSSSVSRILDGLSEHLKSIPIPEENKSSRSYFYRLVRAEINRDIDNSVVLQRHQEVCSYLKNAAIRRLNKWFRGEYV